MFFHFTKYNIILDLKNVESPSSAKSAKKSNFDVSIVNLHLVAEGDFRIESIPKGEAPLLPDIDQGKIKRRLKNAKERIGIGVSTEAQELFDNLQKM